MHQNKHGDHFCQVNFCGMVWVLHTGVVLRMGKDLELMIINNYFKEFYYNK